MRVQKALMFHQYTANPLRLTLEIGYRLIKCFKNTLQIWMTSLYDDCSKVFHFTILNHRSTEHIK